MIWYACSRKHTTLPAVKAFTGRVFYVTQKSPEKRNYYIYLCYHLLLYFVYEGVEAMKNSEVTHHIIGSLLIIGGVIGANQFASIRKLEVGNS